MTTTTNGPRPVRETAEDVLKGGYHDGTEIRPELKHEAPLLLTHALRAAGVQRWQLEAFGMAVRDVGDSEAFEPEAPVSDAQKRMLDAIQKEPSLPAAFKDLLAVAVPTFKQKKHLYVFYGLLRGTGEKWDAVDSVLELAKKENEKVH